MPTAPASIRLCTKLPRAGWTIGLTPKAILCSYSQFCPGGLFLLLFYLSLPEQSPAPSLSFTSITFITCRESKISPLLQHSSCFTSAGHCWSGGCCRHWQCFPNSSRTKTQPLITQFTYCDNFLLTFTVSLLGNTGSSLSGKGKRPALRSSASNLFC